MDSSNPIFLSCPSLFNGINNGQPLAIVDFREKKDFSCSHIRESINRPDNNFDCYGVDDILSILQERPLLSTMMIVYVFPTDYLGRQQMLEHLAVLSDMKIERLHSLHVLDADFPQFRANYGACASMFDGTESPTEHPRVRCYPSEVIPGFMFLGDDRQATDPRVLRGLGITHVLDATGVESSRGVVRSLGLSYLHFDVEDSEMQDIAQHFPEAIAFISSAKSGGGRTLVHCRAGISRSTSFVLAYMLHSRECPSLKAALHAVMLQRPWVSPNIAFRAQLRAYEASMMADQPPSFEGEDDMRQFMQHYLMWYVNQYTSDTPREQVAIRTGLDGSAFTDSARLAVLLAAAEASQPPATEQQGATAGAGAEKPKRPFLRRGQGHTASHS